MPEEYVVKLSSTIHDQYGDVAETVRLSMLEYEVVELAGGAGPCTLAKPGNGKNWVEEEGGLPNYICHVAKSIMHSNPSYDTGRAIAAAISQIKKWIADPDTKASTKAKATKAIAEWEAKKAKAKARPNKK